MSIKSHFPQQLKLEITNCDFKISCQLVRHRLTFREGQINIRIFLATGTSPLNADETQWN